MTRTKAGLILEKLLHDNKHRWLFCWNGEHEDAAYDCACCLTWPNDELYTNCGCLCHTRIEAMARITDMKLFLLAAEAMGELPKFFASYAEKLTYSKPILVEHEEHRKSHISVYDFGPCTCEFCEFARNDPKIRKFEIEGEDNSHVCSDEKPPLRCYPETEVGKLGVRLG